MSDILGWTISIVFVLFWALPVVLLIWVIWQVAPGGGPPAGGGGGGDILPGGGGGGHGAAMSPARQGRADPVRGVSRDAGARPGAQRGIPAAGDGHANRGAEGPAAGAARSGPGDREPGDAGRQGRPGGRRGVRLLELQRDSPRPDDPRAHRR